MDSLELRNLKTKVKGYALNMGLLHRDEIEEVRYNESDALPLEARFKKKVVFNKLIVY